MAWQQPQLTDPPMMSDEIGRIQHRLIFAYPKASLAVELGVRESKVFDSATKTAVVNFQHYINDHQLNTPPLRTDGVADYATKVRMGVIVAAPIIRPRHTFISVNGTAVPDPFGPGFPADIGRALNTQLWYWQPIGYPAATFPMGPSVDAGVAEVLHQLDRHPGTFALSGYSQGALVTDIVWRNHLLNGSHAHRKGDCIAIVNFGDPMRCPGIANGNTYEGRSVPKKLDGYTTGGIAGPDCLTPEQTPEFLLSFANDGDLYASAPVGDTPWIKETLVGHNETLIFNAIMQFDGTDLIAFTMEIAQILGQPLAQIIPLVEAIWNGLTFLVQGTNAPHWTYNIDAALRYLAERAVQIPARAA